jgi:hexosaminidase
MKPKCYLSAALILASICITMIYGSEIEAKTPLHLMPMPLTVTPGEGRFRIQQDFGISLTGCQNSQIANATARMLQRLRAKTGLPIAIRPDAKKKSAETALHIHCREAGEAVQSINANEDYQLEATPQSIRLEAVSPLGIIRGLETLLQLIEIDDQSFFIPAIKISDHPRFPWRGLLIDASRHWIPAEVIKRNLDAMAAVKMNVLHWHLSDDQGFRVESLIFPELHKVASEGNYYTQKQITDIVAYARDRGIRVVPEFDMPGHTSAWMAAYPKLASATGPFAIERAWGVFDPCMDPTREQLYVYLNDFIGEMAKLFPDEYFHIGGDEVNGKQWNANPRIQAFKAAKGLKNNHDLQAYFNQRLQKILKKHHKKMIGWDEIIHPGLPTNVVVQSWRSKPPLAESLSRGYAGILSRGYYLDHMQPAAFHYMNDPEGTAPNALTEAEKNRILGGEACMWAEFVNEDTVESRIWPRAASIAERLWSPQGVQSIQDMYRRLEHTNQELQSLGIMTEGYYIRTLQTMAGDNSFSSIKSITDLLKPVSLAIRQRTQKYYSFTPLNRLADILPPESGTAREFENTIDQALADVSAQSDDLAKAKGFLSRWQITARQVSPITEQSFLLKEIQPVFASVASLSSLGLEAIAYIERKESPSSEWRKNAALLIQQLEKPQAETMIAIVPAIKKLIESEQLAGK